MKATINISKAASKLADERVKENFRRALIVATNYNPTPEQVEELIYQKDNDGTTIYKPEAQQIFNGLYDMFHNTLLECKSSTEEGTLFKNEFEISDEIIQNSRVNAELIVKKHSKDMVQGIYNFLNKNYSIKNTGRNSKKFNVEFIINILKND